MTIATAISAVGTLLSGMQNDDASLTIQRIFTATPEQPQPSDFPAIIIEFPDDQEGTWARETMGNPGLGRNDYRLHIIILVGAPANTPISQLHNLAIAWVKPLADKLLSNSTLTGGVAFTGFPTDNTAFTYFIQQINWNQQIFFGVRAITGITEKHSQTQG